MVAGSARSELFAGSILTVGHLTRRWPILTLCDKMIITSHDHKALYKRDIVLDKVPERCDQKFRVYAPYTMVSPLAWSELPAGPNMLAEPAFPTRALRVLALEMTPRPTRSAIRISTTTPTSSA